MDLLGSLICLSFRWLPLSIFCLFLSTGAQGEGLRLFSYFDGAGRYFVVDSLEKVPTRFRGSVEEAMVRPFRKPFSASFPSVLAPASDASDDPVTSSATLISEGAGKAAPSLEESDQTLLHLEAPPPESTVATDPAWASASLWLNELSGLQDRGEKIWGLAKMIAPTQRQILVWEWESMQTLESLREFSSLQWDRGKTWLETAAILTDQYRVLFYTLKKWLDEGGKHLLKELPELLNRTRSLLEKLRRELPPPVLPDSQ